MEYVLLEMVIGEILLKTNKVVDVGTKSSFENVIVVIMVFVGKSIIL